MGLFSDRGRLPRVANFRMPIRVHSEYRVSDRLARGARGLRSIAVALSNDARVVGVVLLLAAAALAMEMAASFK